MDGLEREKLELLLGTGIFRGAMNCHRRQKVLTFDCDHRTIRASVLGSRGSKYKVKIRLSEEDSITGAHCTCEFPFYCKHIGAVMLQYLNQRSPQVRELRDTEKQEITISFRKNDFLLNPFVEALRSHDGRFAARAREKAHDERYKLIFTIEPVSRHSCDGSIDGWMLACGMRYIRRDGRIGRYREYSDYSVSEPATEKEMALFNVLAARERRRDVLEPYLGFLTRAPAIVPLLKQGGPLKEIACVPVAKTVIRFQLVEMHLHEPLFLPICEFHDDFGLRCTLAPPQEPCAGSEAFYVVDAENGLLIYRKDDIHYRHILKSVLQKTDQYSYTDILYLQQYVEKNCGASLQISFSARQVRIIRRRPVATLELREAWPGLQIELLFIYEGKDFPSSPTAKLLRLESTEDECLAVKSDNDFERGRFLALKSIISERWDAPFLSFTTGVGELSPALLIDVDMQTFLIELGEKLMGEGFQLRNKGCPIKKGGRISIHISRHMDWLDLEVSLEDDQGQRLHLDPRALEGTFVRSEKHYHLLSREDIERLKALLAQGSIQDDKLRISRYQYALVEELYEVLENQRDEQVLRIRRILAGLRDFQSIDDVSPSTRFRGTLRDYQRAGLSWLHFLFRYEVNGCLADDMGLGKTVQALALLQKIKEGAELDQALIVAPVSTLANWENEIARFTPDLSVTLHHGPSRARDTGRMTQADIILTSYHTLRIDIELFRQLHFTYLILDEAQMIKNPTARVHRCMRLISADRRLSLTGTPVENDTIELWAQMNFLNPGLL